MDFYGNNDFFLDFSICKSVDGKTDANGNYIFQVEASNENVDLQDQIVLQSALMESKDNFIKKGVISWDHQHKMRKPDGSVESVPENVIGEPLDVWTDGKSTFVKGILYKSNDKAKDIIQKLQDGSTRIRASVGGIFPKIKKAANGIEQITHVLWNDLALTTSPVNNTVGSAVFAKSLTAQEFADTYKSLSAGYGTDSANKEGGNALIPEDMAKNTFNIVPESAGIDLDDVSQADVNSVIQELTKEMEFGNITDFNVAVNFLMDNGIDQDESRAIVREIINKGGTGKMKKSIFAQTCDEMLKSMAEEDAKDKDMEDTDQDEPEFDFDDTDSEDDQDEDKEETKKSCKKSFDEEEMVDGTELIKSLKDENEAIHEELRELRKSMEDLGQANVLLAEMVKSLSDEPLPMNSTMSKSIDMTSNQVKQPEGRPTQEDFLAVRNILCKSVAAGELDLVKSTMYENEVQLAMKTGKKMSDECFTFISNKMKNC
ncbi:MAG: hypothetical protein MJZ37_00780 [Bacilli bacterium]|nr:hypothetical protein [Bacilli bacterium]